MRPGCQGECPWEGCLGIKKGMGYFQIMMAVINSLYSGRPNGIRRENAGRMGPSSVAQTGPICEADTMGGETR